MTTIVPRDKASKVQRPLRSTLRRVSPRCKTPPLTKMSRPQLLSIPERLDASPRFTGRGVVICLVDSGFYPHPDLMRPRRRIKAYADATRDEAVADDFFTPRAASWHGTMTACTAAGNGYVSGGRYRGL